MNIFQQITLAFEPLLLIGASVSTAILALSIYRNDRSSATNKIFVGLSLSIMLWVGAAYLSSIQSEYILWIHRLAIAFAASTSTFLFLLAYVLPSRKIQMTRTRFTLVIVLTISMMALSLSPYTFTGVEADGSPIPGPGFLFFGVVSTIFSLLAIFYLVKKSLAGSKVTQYQSRTVLAGMLTMLLLVIGTILIPIILLQSTLFIPLIPLYVLIFLGTTAYAITKYHLFNVKVLVARAITYSIWIALFAKLFVINQSRSAQFIDAALLLFMIIFGLLLVRSVKREVEAREKIESLAKSLEKANARLKELDKLKTEFVSIASHQLRSPLAAVKGYASMLLEGSFGKLSVGAQEAIGRIFTSSSFMARSVDDFLNVSRIELGRMKYEPTVFDICKIIELVVEEQNPFAENKGLKLTYENHSGANTCEIYADIGKIKQVLTNIVDNAIKYTTKGFVRVDFNRDREAGCIQIEVTDSGLGMTQETIDKLFKKFARADDANEVNVIGTGLGLYVAKQLIEAQKGKIWVTSPGSGKGSTFHIELPDATPTKNTLKKA